MEKFWAFLCEKFEEARRDTYAISVCPAFFVFFGLYTLALGGVESGGTGLLHLLCSVLILTLCLVVATSRLHYRSEFTVTILVLLVLFLGMVRVANYIEVRYEAKGDVQSLNREVVTLSSRRKWGRAEALVFKRDGGDRFVYYNWDGDDTDYLVGASYTVTGLCQPFRERKNSSTFDEWKFWQSRGVSSCFIKRGEIIPTLPPSGIFALRQFLGEKINSCLLEKSQGYMKIFLLGEKQQKFEGLYKEIGVVHILSISGLHVALLLALLCFIVKNKFLRFYLGTFLLWGFVYMVGCPVSAVRSGIMAQALLLSLIFDLPRSSINAVCLAACLIILANPFCVVDVGFTLSFVCVLFLSTAPVGYDWNILSCCTLNALIWVVTAPILAHFFKAVPISAIIGNIFILPVFGIVFPLAIVLCLCSFVFPFLFPQVLEALLASFENLAELLGKFPAMTVCKTGFLTFCAAFIFFWCLFRRLTENKAKSTALALGFSVVTLVIFG